MSAVTQEQVKAKKNELKRKTPASWLVFFGVLLLVIVWPQVSLFLPGLISPEMLK